MLIIFRDVMVANAHQMQEAEEKKLFDIVYLVGVIGIILAIAPLPFAMFLKNEQGIPFVNQCKGKDIDHDTKYVLFLIGTAFGCLFFYFTVSLGLRTKKNLRKLQDQHLVNLPSNNALTYLDTLILCLLINVAFLFRLCLPILFRLQMISSKDLFLVASIFQMIMPNIVMSFMFPVYIILKTRRYLPRLWNDNSPIIIGNNDFYASRLSQISPHVDTAESRF